MKKSRVDLQRQHDALLKRLDVLYEKGFDAFMIEGDFNVCDYLSEEDAEEYMILIDDLDKIEELIAKEVK